MNFPLSHAAMLTSRVTVKTVQMQLVDTVYQALFWALRTELTKASKVPAAMSHSRRALTLG